ncbi:MAG: transposase [Bacteroidota bacterium]
MSSRMNFTNTSSRSRIAMWSYLAVFWQSCGCTTEGLAHRATSSMVGKKGLTTLGATEFLRRFCLHILTRLRHYGILAGRSKTQALAQARESLEVEPPPSPSRKTGRRNSRR